MPLNSIPPTTTVENLAAKRNAARGQCWTDVAFWGGVIPGNQVRNFVQLPCYFYCN
jgi:allantoinase